MQHVCTRRRRGALVQRSGVRAVAKLACAQLGRMQRYECAPGAATTEVTGHLIRRDDHGQMWLCERRCDGSAARTTCKRSDRHCDRSAGPLRRARLAARIREQ